MNFFPYRLSAFEVDCQGWCCISWRASENLCIMSFDLPHAYAPIVPLIILIKLLSRKIPLKLCSMGIFTGSFLWFSMLKLISFQATVIKHYNLPVCGWHQFITCTNLNEIFLIHVNTYSQAVN